MAWHAAGRASSDQIEARRDCAGRLAPPGSQEETKSRQGPGSGVGAEQLGCAKIPEQGMQAAGPVPIGPDTDTMGGLPQPASQRRVPL